MDSSKGKLQHGKNYRSSTSPHNRYHESNNLSLPSSHGIFRATRIQRQTLKWRKDNYYKGNYRSRLQFRRNDFNSKKTNKTTEDIEEEERKKKLTDTAKKLLSKIKTWNADKSCSEDDSQQSSNVDHVSENSCEPAGEKICAEGKPKRIAHSKKTKLVKSRAPKSFNQPIKTLNRYDVNKETVKNFQNRIQHKLIEEIMQMPKENLQNVLNDPKINPIMELKMSRLVRENKLLIAQKLRALAESKMKSLNCPTNPQFLFDIDKLIDPVIETDLSVLPYELIKQMENVFQVQFDYTPGSTDSQVENNSCDSAINNLILEEEEVGMEVDSLEQNIKEEKTEDLSFYECSTDEDEDMEISGSQVVSSEKECDSEVKNNQVINSVEENKKQRLLESFQSAVDNDVVHELIPSSSSTSSLVSVSVNSDEKSLQNENISHINNPHSCVQLETSPCVPVDNSCNALTPTKDFTSISCQTDCSFENASTQTSPLSDSTKSLLEAPLFYRATEETIPSLLEELNSLQNFLNKLNERRLMIFLQLARMNPSGNFLNNDTTEKNFIETVSNGNFNLTESLKEFFTSQSKRRNNYSKYRSRSKGRNQRLNKNKSKEEK